MRIAPLDARTAAAWAGLFERCGSACYCRYWHFAGTKNDWLARCVNEPEQNRDDHLAAIARGAPESGGLVALDGHDVVGWMKLVPRAAVAKLLRQGPYRAAVAADAEPEGVWSIGCFLVDPTRRRTGVSRALIHASPVYVHGKGGTVVEAYPRRTDGDVDSAQAWTGTVRLFASCGFEERHPEHSDHEPPYPIMRRRAAP